MHKSIQKKMIIYILPIVFIVLAISLHVSMVNSKLIIKQELYQTIDAKQDEQSKAIEDAISKVKGTTDIFASSVGSTYEYLDADIYNKIIKNVLLQDDKLRSVGVWFEPYKSDKDQKYERYFVENIDGVFLINTEYNSSEFDYLNDPLYIEAKKQNKGFFSEAHYHELSYTYTITYVAPIQNSKGEFIGCITSSFDINDLKDLIDKYDNGYINFYIIDNNGVYIGNTDLELIKSRVNIKDCEVDFSKQAETILTTNSGTLTHEKNDELYYIYYETIQEFGWKLVYEVPSSYINKPLIELTAINIFICIISVCIIIALILHVTKRFVHNPLHLLLDDFKNISNNVYYSEIPNKLLQTNTEFSDIGMALNDMKLNLTDYQSRLIRKNHLLVENQNSLKDAVDYVNTIISALPIMMFVFDRDGFIIELHGQTPFENRPKDFYEGKHYLDLLTDNPSTIIGITELLDTVKTIDYNDGVVHREISTIINGNEEHFEHNITLCQDNVIISLCRRVTDTVNHIKDMEYLSDFDELTGLYNSRYFIDVLKNHVEHSVLPISIIVCDVNGFKSINDQYGYVDGDQLLVDLTVVLNEINVENKSVFRVAGDEFGIILPNTTKEKAEKIIEDIYTKCLLGQVSEIPFSIGYGVDTQLSEDESLLKLIKSVEETLYMQKVYTSSGKKDNSIGLINSIYQAKNKREQLHSNRVSEICLEMAKVLGWSQLEQNKISTAGLLHDIGKIGISDSLLNKPGRLTEEEYAEMCTHPEIGYQILQTFENMKELSEFAYSHHEKWDGTGYPRKLKGTEIPIEARIIAIADTYDAMTSSRSYREGLPKEVAIRELIKCKNNQLDPELVDVFIEKVLLEKLEDYQV